MRIFTTYFESNSLEFLVPSILLLFLCIVSLIEEKEKLSVLFLVLSSFLLFCFAASLDPFLNLWDERFHALVAKNYLKHPFIPTLYDNPIVSMPYDKWDRYHLWFHKQPLFLWQIACSFKLFGVSEFSLRIPSIVMGTILTYVTYKSGRLLVNYKTGILAGILFLTSNYLLELVSGRKGLDHNDFSFLFYISLSIWSLIEYQHSKNKRWIYLIGLFSGLAILCKWLVGLLVYFGWFILKLVRKQFSIQKYLDMIFALVITIIIAAPWQIYEFVKYPKEALKEYQFYAEHFNVPLDGHSGTWLYHFECIPEIYGIIGAILLFPSLILLKRRLKINELFWFIISNILVVYFFFTLAQTKMPSFTIVLFMLIAIALASLYESVIVIMEKVIKNKTIKKSAVLIFISCITYFNLNIEKIQAKHTSWKSPYPDRKKLIHNTKIFKALDLPTNTVIFNVKGRHYIECMFYTDIPSYNFIPSIEQYNDLKEKRMQIAIFTPKKGLLPDYLNEDENIIFINEKLQGYE